VLPGFSGLHMEKRRDPVFRIAKTAAHLVLPFFFRVETYGLENLPRRSAFVLLPKHQRWEDIPLLGIVTPRPLYYIAKSELFDSPVTNWLLRSMGGIPLNRQRPLVSRRYLLTTIGLLKKGEGVVVFPEGTYHRDEMGKGHIGIVRLIATRLSLPFIPVGIHYSSGKGRTLVSIKFGKPCYKEPDLAPIGFFDYMMQEIATLSGLI